MYDTNFLASRLAKATCDSLDRNFAILPDQSSMQYRDLFTGAERMAEALVLHGVRPGDRVAVQIDKSMEMLQLYIATILAGGVFLPLNTAYTPAEIAYFLGDACPTVFVCDPAKKDALAAIAQDAGVGHTETLDGAGKGSFADLASQQAGGFAAVSRSGEDLAAILYTSGTTGRSKGAMLSHDNLWSNAAILREYWQFSADDVLIHALPIFHTHGLFVATNVILAAGASLIFMPAFDTDAIINALPQASVLMGVPTFYTRLLQHDRLDKDLVRNMRLFISGSAPLLAETHIAWQQKTGHAILERYGMTETNMNTSNPYEGARRAGTVGFPLPGVEVKITDPETGHDLPPGDIGLIEVRGPNVFKGYWQMPEKTAEELRANGFFITGDLGMMNDQGYLSIIGRSKDLIITGGYNVYPKEVELVIDDLPGVLESAVIGVPHADFGEAVAAVIVKNGREDINADQVKTSLKDKLARFKQPQQIHFMDALPRNTMGKVQKNLLRQQYGG